MNNNTFDERLKTALANLEVPYEPATWTELSNKLDNLSAAPLDEGVGAWMDAPLSEKLNRIEVPFQSAHWDLMEARLEAEKRRRRRVWMTKLAEAAVFLLLLVNLQTWIGGRPADGSEDSTRYALGPQAGAQPKTGKLQSHRMHTAQAAQAAAGVGSVLAAFPDENAAGTPAEPSATDVLNAGDHHNATATDIIADVLLPLLHSEAAQALQQPSAQPAIAGNLDYLPFGTLENMALPYPRAAQAVPVPNVLKKTRASRGLYAAAATGIQFDQFGTGSSKNVPGGLVVGYRKGKWGVEGGVFYQRKRFQPKKSVEIYAGNAAGGYYGSYLAAVDADVIGIPVHATRQIAKAGKMTIHAVAGLTANIATQKGYRNKTIFYPGSSPSRPDPGQQPPAPLFKNEGVGLLEKGGQLKGNAYASADAGLRLEAPISRRANLFVESTYRHALPIGEGLAPQTNNINTVAINAGVMTGF